MVQNIEAVIVKIEDYINSQGLRSEKPTAALSKSIVTSGSAVAKFSDAERKSIDEYLAGVKALPTQQDYVNDKLPVRGFVYKDGQPNYPKFYNYARINPDVWHTFITKKNKPSEDTMFKIIIALQLDEDDAEFFLNLGGASFGYSNKMHRYILACINTKIYDPDEVYEVLEFYKVHNIYAEKKRRKECK